MSLGENVKRKVVRILVFFVFGSTILLTLGVLYSELFVIGILFLGAAAGIALMGLACPTCGYSILFQEQKAFGLRFKAFSPWPLPKTCKHCGKAFDE